LTQLWRDILAAENLALPANLTLRRVNPKPEIPYILYTFGIPWVHGLPVRHQAIAASTPNDMFLENKQVS